MSNKQAPTQRQRAERARRQAMGIAVIQRPLKYIKSRANIKDTDEAGRVHISESRVSRLADIAARNGAGEEVKKIARGLS